MSEATEISNETNLTWWERHGQRTRWVIQIAIAAVIVAVIIWRTALASVSVASHTVATEAVIAEVMGTGTLEARTSSVVGPKIGGLIAYVAVDQGDRVEAGALLFRLEDSDIKQQVEIARSEVDAANATLDRLNAIRRGAEAVLAQAKTNHERILALSSRNAASRQDLDKAYEAKSVAQAEFAVAGAGIIEGNKRLDAANRSLEYQRARLQDTTIEAPFDGLIVRRDRDVGDVVAPAASVFKIISTDEMWITAWVDETELSRLHENQPARIEFRSQPGIEYSGGVARMGREVDRETREILVDVSVDRLPKSWAVGQRAEVFIQVEKRNGVTAIPGRFVLIRDGEQGVLLDDGGRARWRTIRIGLVGRERVAVIEGLSVGDVLLNPTDLNGARLRDGRRVMPQ